MALVDPPESVSAQVMVRIDASHSRPHRVCFTHNDLGPHNILVDEEFNITGVIDWERSAWMPEYWEFVSSTYMFMFRKGFWFNIMSAVFSEYKDEREVDMLIVKYRSIYM